MFQYLVSILARTNSTVTTSTIRCKSVRKSLAISARYGGEWQYFESLNKLICSGRLSSWAYEMYDFIWLATYLPDGRNMALDLDIFEQQRWQRQLANAGVQLDIFPIFNNGASDGSTAEYLQFFRW